MDGVRMAVTMLKIDLRRSKILERLKRDGMVSVAQLAQELGTTPVTIRSDLDALEKDGCLMRVQGGAVRKPDATQSRQISFDNAEQKKAIADAVAGMIRDGDTLFINSGTTMQLVAAALHKHRNLNIVTNAVQVALELGKIPTFRVILLGGEINAQYGFTYGSTAQEQLSHYQADWAVLSLDGISVSGGMTTYHAEESTLNRMMVTQAKQVLVAADHTKIGRAGFFRFYEVRPGTCLITDTMAQPESVSVLQEKGIKVYCAK